MDDNAEVSAGVADVPSRWMEFISAPTCTECQHLFGTSSNKSQLPKRLVGNASIHMDTRFPLQKQFLDALCNPL